MRSKIDARAWSNEQLRMIGHRLPAISSALNVSGYRDSDKHGGTYREYFPASEYTISNYAGDSVRGISSDMDLNLDLSHDVPEELLNRFDLVFSHTVLEHLEDPWAAFRRICSLSRDLVITVAPFAQVMHFFPGEFGDYYRFSPLAMRSLYAANGMTVLWEAFTPPPSLTVYVVYAGSRQPERHTHWARPLLRPEQLRNEVGRQLLPDLVRHIGWRLANRASRLRQRKS